MFGAQIEAKRLRKKATFRQRSTCDVRSASGFCYARDPVATPPGARCGVLFSALERLQRAYIGSRRRSCKQKRPRRAALIRLKSLRDFGAGEGIRTLDPNLGKVFRAFTPQH